MLVLNTPRHAGAPGEGCITQQALPRGGLITLQPLADAIKVGYDAIGTACVIRLRCTR